MRKSFGEAVKDKRESYRPRAFQDTEKSELILRLRFGLEEPGKRFTLDEIGDRFGVSRERIRQIQAKYKRLFPARYRELEAQAPPKPVSVFSVKKEHRRQRKAVLKMAQKKTLTVQGLSAANVPLEGLSEQSSERDIFEAMHLRFRLTHYGEFVWCSIGKHTVNVSEMPNGKYKHTPTKTRVCTACNTKRMRKTWAEHREERLAYSREYQKRPKAKAYQREWKKKRWSSMTPEERKEKRRQHYLKNRERILASIKKYYQKNKEKLAEKKRAWAKRYRLQNKEKVSQLNHARYLAKKALAAASTPSAA